MIITLCGSARFEDIFKALDEQLTLDGHTVFTLSVYPSTKGGNKDWYTSEIKVKLDAAHLRKIDASDAIVVITGRGLITPEQRYIGESTTREIGYAARTGKRIYFTDQMCHYNGCSDRFKKRPPCALCYE